jgi:hypothetical protein
MAPLPAMGLVGNPDVAAVAKEADARLRAALDRLERGEAMPVGADRGSSS